jgi:hypothetical protein
MSKAAVTISITLRPEHTLAEAWTWLAKPLASTGAHEEQIHMMRIMFFMGAAQAYARIDGNATSFDSFCDIMKDVYAEIDDVLCQADFGTVGNA